MHILHFVLHPGETQGKAPLFPGNFDVRSSILPHEGDKVSLLDAPVMEGQEGIYKVTGIEHNVSSSEYSGEGKVFDMDLNGSTIEMKRIKRG